MNFKRTARRGLSFFRFLISLFRFLKKLDQQIPQPLRLVDVDLMARVLEYDEVGARQAFLQRLHRRHVLLVLPAADEEHRASTDGSPPD